MGARGGGGGGGGGRGGLKEAVGEVLCRFKNFCGVPQVPMQ